MFSLFFDVSLVTQITEKNIDTILSNKSHPPVFLAITSMWCSHCFEMKPEWEALEDYYKNDTDIVIATIDLEESRPLTKRFESFSGTPSIFWITKTPESAIKYKESNKFEEFIQYIEKIRQPPIIFIENQTDFQNHLKDQEKFSIFLLQGNISSESFNIIKNISDTFNLFPIRIFYLKFRAFNVTEPYLANFFSLSFYSDIYNGNWNNVSLYNFFNLHKFPPMAEATSQFFSLVLHDSSIKKFVLFQDSDEEPYLKNISKITLNFPGVFFGHINCMNHIRTCLVFGLNQVNQKIISVVEPKWNRYYLYRPSQFHDKRVINFLNRALAGKWPQSGPGAGFKGLIFNSKLYIKNHKSFFIFLAFLALFILLISIVSCLLCVPPSNTSRFSNERYFEEEEQTLIDSDSDSEDEFINTNNRIELEQDGKEKTD